MTEMLEWIHAAVWGAPALFLIICAGLINCWKTRFCQITFLPAAFRRFFYELKKPSGSSSDISGYRALCTALAATVGTGNIAGVAGALCLGGPGAVFWMWICGILGMGIKYAEATLAVRYRQKNRTGEWVGGPMYMIRNGLGKNWIWLAYAYCVLGVIASFGIGNATQVNAVISSLSSSMAGFDLQLNDHGKLIIGLVLAVTVSVVSMGGGKRIGQLAQQLVPAASIVYIVMCFFVITIRFSYLDDAFSAIFSGAFEPNAVTGGIIGSVFSTLRIGVSRGIFTNEAGMGTASIAHGSANVSHPAQQGLMGIMEVFLDTIVICTMTALAILTSGIHIPYGVDAGAELTSGAFSLVFGDFASVLLFCTLSCFAFATIFGWGLYGIRCAEFLFGEKAATLFPIFQGGVVLISVFGSTGTVWLICDILNGLMTIPNLIAVLMLMPELVRLTQEYRPLQNQDALMMHDRQWKKSPP